MTREQKEDIAWKSAMDWSKKEGGYDLFFRCDFSALEALDRMREKLTEEILAWEDHAIRGMKKGNTAYFQGQVALCEEFLDYLNEMDKDAEESEER